MSILTGLFDSAITGRALAASLLLWSTITSAEFADYEIPLIPYESVPNFLKYSPEMNLGEVLAVAVNSHGHVMVLNHPGSASNGGPLYRNATSQLLEFDANGNFLREIGQNVYGLGYSRSKKAATFLAGAHGAGDPDFRLRATAARSLGVLGMADADGTLRTMLSDPAAEVRWTAAAVLGRLNDPASGEALVASLADRHPEVRAQAALSLGYLGYAAAQPRLEMLISQDESRRVREAAAFSATLLAR